MKNIKVIKTVPVEKYTKRKIPFTFKGVPRSMDNASRNARLYKKLLEFGLFVQPLPNSTGGIDCFIVSTGVPAYVPQAQG